MERAECEACLRFLWVFEWIMMPFSGVENTRQAEAWEKTCSLWEHFVPLFRKKCSKDIGIYVVELRGK